MNFSKLNNGWNAAPNAPMPQLYVAGSDVTIEFFLNHFMFPRYNEDDLARLTFANCHKYHFKGTNDEGYFRGQHRYNYSILPWGEFYQLETDWKADFPENAIILSESVDDEKLKHYIFFFRDECFECVAENYKMEFITA